MHIIKDENGNVCPHGHEHSHEHGHAHTHDGVCQEGCGGCEPHDPKKENIALLTYMLQHNEHHAAELDQMADKLRKAVDEFQKGNLYLSVALATVKEN